MAPTGLRIIRARHHPGATGGLRKRFRRLAGGGRQRAVTDGPFAKTGGLIAGYWPWEVASMAEAIERLRRDPTGGPGTGSADRRRRAEPAPKRFGLSPSPQGFGHVPVSGKMCVEEPCMATVEEFRRLALAFDGVTETPHGDRTGFRVARIFATLAPSGATASLKLSLDEQRLKCAMHPDAFAPVPSRWGAQGWTCVRLDAIAPPTLHGALGLAWRHAHRRRRSAKRRETTG